jgi:hypothetical protein
METSFEDFTGYGEDVSGCPVFGESTKNKFHELLRLDPPRARHLQSSDLFVYYAMIYEYVATNIMANGRALWSRGG